MLNKILKTRNAIDNQIDSIVKQDETDRRSSGDKAKDVAATQDLRDMITMFSDNSSEDESLAVQMHVQHH